MRLKNYLIIACYIIFCSKLSSQVIVEGYFGKPDTSAVRNKLKIQLDSVCSFGTTLKNLADRKEFNRQGQLTYYSQYLWITGEKAQQEEYFYDVQSKLVRTMLTMYPKHPDYVFRKKVYDEAGNFMRYHKLTPEQNLIVNTKYIRYAHGNISAYRYYYDDTILDTVSINYFSEDVEPFINSHGNIEIRYDKTLLAKDSATDKLGNPIITFTHKLLRIQSFLKYHSIKHDKPNLRGLLSEYYRDSPEGRYTTQFTYNHLGRVQSMVTISAIGASRSQQFHYYGNRHTQGERLVQNIILFQDNESVISIFYEYYPTGKISVANYYSLQEKNWVLDSKMLYSENGLITKFVDYTEKVTHDYSYQYFD
jgi:hypothetical protein